MPTSDNLESTLNHVPSPTVLFLTLELLGGPLPATQEEQPTSRLPTAPLSFHFIMHTAASAEQFGKELAWTDLTLVHDVLGTLSR